MCSKIPISPKEDISIIILQNEQNNRTTEHTELFELDEDSESVSYVITKWRTKQNKGRGGAWQFHWTDCICHHTRATYTDHHTRHKNSKRQQRKLIDKKREAAKQEMTKRDKTD